MRKVNASLGWEQEYFLIDEALVKEERRNVGRVAAFDPLDLFGAGDVAGGSGEFDAEDSLFFVTRSSDENAAF